MGRLAFGVDEKLHCIADVQLKGPDGEALCMGYKTSVRMIGGPVWISDDGYVLVVKSGMSRYFDPPTGEELVGMQQAGLMPDPLPSPATHSSQGPSRGSLPGPRARPATSA